METLGAILLLAFAVFEFVKAFSNLDQRPKRKKS